MRALAILISFLVTPVIASDGCRFEDVVKSRSMLYWWSKSFKYGLYDAATPIGYTRSLNQAFQLLNPGKDDKIIDFGSGTGQLLSPASQWLKQGGKLTEVDINPHGLRSAQRKAKKLGVSPNVTFQQKDLVSPTIESLGQFDGGIAHFSVYTIPKDNQIPVLENMRRALKPGKKLVITVPSENYTAQSIVDDSVNIEKGRTDTGSLGKAFRTAKLKTLTKKGLSFIEEQMDQGVFSRYTQAELRALLEEAGFEVLEIQPTYGNSGYHAVVRRLE